MRLVRVNVLRGGSKEKEKNGRRLYGPIYKETEKQADMKDEKAK